MDEKDSDSLHPARGATSEKESGRDGAAAFDQAERIHLTGAGGYYWARPDASPDEHLAKMCMADIRALSEQYKWIC